MRNEKRFKISIFQKKKPFSTRLPSISIQIHPLSCVLIIIIASARICTKEFTISPLHTLHGTTHPSYQGKKRRNKNLSRRLTVCELFVYYLCLFVVIIIIAKRFHFFFLLPIEVPAFTFFSLRPMGISPSTIYRFWEYCRVIFCCLITPYIFNGLVVCIVKYSSSKSMVNANR